MSVALYRKYRPGSFAEVRGQEHVTEPLQQALRNGRVHHAYLFSGPRGCGKTSSARILARSLNCEQGPTADPCGECEPCVALGPTGAGSVDVIEIDAASHGGVDDARDLRERAFFAPASSRFKVYVIDEAHMVTREGFNALLKLVEEPPPHLKFVFATTEPDKVINTIRSRTHHYPFRLLPPSLLRELLADICAREGIEVEPAALPLVVRAGAGSVRDALSILDQILAGAQAGQVTYAQAVGLLGYTDASLLDEVVEAFAAGDGAAVFEVVNRVVEGGNDPRRFAADLLERFRDLVVLRSVPDAATKGLLDQPPDQLERMSAQAGRMGWAELSRAADLFHEGLTEMRGATSPRLLLELICARVLLPGAAEGEAALLARLERVERRISIGGAPAASAQGAGDRRDTGESASGGASAASATPEAAAPAEPAVSSQQDAEVRQARQESPAPGTDWPEVATPGSAASPEEPTGGQAAATDSANSADSAEPAAEPEYPAPTAPQQSAGRLDAAAVRRAWPDVLEDVKHRRRVAWMILIGDVYVSAVDERSLTLAFAKEGDRKGFTGSGCDRVLQEALQQVLGVQWEILTTTGSGGVAQESPGGGPPATDPAGAAGSPAAGIPDTAGPAPAAGQEASSAAGGSLGSGGEPVPEDRSAGGGTDTSGAGGDPPAPRWEAPARGEAGSQDAVDPGPAAHALDEGETAGLEQPSPVDDAEIGGGLDAEVAASAVPDTLPAPSSDGSSSTRDSGTADGDAMPSTGLEGTDDGVGRRGSAPSSRSMSVPSTSSPAVAEGSGLSGMALIQRELGAEVVEEIDHS